MNQVKIFGLPVPVLRRYRVVLDQGMCRLYGIPGNGQVMARIGPDFISVFPPGPDDIKKSLKRESIGRFNLPILWARKNGVIIGESEYLFAGETGIQIRKQPVSLEQCREYRIFGIPAKIYQENLVYIPKRLWLQYDIEPEHGKVIREEKGNCFVFRPYRQNNLHNISRPVHINQRLVHIQTHWMKENHACRRQYLDMWDFVWTDVISRSYL